MKDSGRDRRKRDILRKERHVKREEDRRKERGNKHVR